MKLFTESFDSSLPKWLRDFLSRSKNIANGLAVDKLKFTRVDLPTSTKSFRKTGKFGTMVFLLYNKHVYFPGVNDDYKFINISFKSTSIDEILSNTIDIGYVNTKDEGINTRELQAARRASRVGYISNSERRKNAQYKRLDRVEDTYTWETKPNFDKSGYLLDPEKYKKMLDDVNLSTYKVRLDMYYKKLENLKATVVNSLNDMSISKFPKSRDLFDALDNLKYAMDSYNNLNKEIERYVEDPEPYRDRNIIQAFRWYGPRIREYIDSTRKYLERVKNDLQ